MQGVDPAEYAKELLLFADTGKVGGEPACTRCKWILGRLMEDEARKAILDAVAKELGL